MAGAIHRFAPNEGKEALRRMGTAPVKVVVSQFTDGSSNMQIGAATTLRRKAHVTHGIDRDGVINTNIVGHADRVRKAVEKQLGE